MAIKYRYEIVCDGCGKTLMRNEQPAKDVPHFDVHICVDCAEEEKYFCRLCQQVHNDNNPCEQMKEEILQALKAGMDSAGMDASIMSFSEWRKSYGGEML